MKNNKYGEHAVCVSGVANFSNSPTLQNMFFRNHSKYLP